MRTVKLKLLIVCIIVGCLAAWPAYAKPYPNFRLITLNGWEDALSSGDVRPMTPSEWSEYITQFNNPDNLEGAPYPDTTFREARLGVCGGGGGGGGCAEYEDAGVVMTWGDGTETVGQDYASAWIYQYKVDPDLSNSTITVTVEPPCIASITTISLGLQDNNGRIRSWTWNVVAAGPPGVGQILCSPKPPNILTTVTINLAQTGVGAATPQAASYSNYNGPPPPAFNIKNVTAISFDENATWLATMPVPPTGGAAGAWNYWRNLTVTLNPPPAGSDTGKWFIKWSQRPVEWSTDPNFILGWDERSDYNDPCNLKIMADDWKCKDDRPITDVHWWGSFIGWIQPHPPPIVPQAFHIGIWTDMPFPDPCNTELFSHPDKMIWENYCDNWVWNFAGYDKDPCDRPEHRNEACFQYNQLLSEDEWFYQEPDPCDPNGRIYWLSIAAVFSPNDYNDPNFLPWGWKSRPHNFQDDATSITALADGTWPPTVGSQWSNGAPLKGPLDETWDLAFELTTNEGLSGDLDFDAKVDFLDLSIMADRWLRSIP